MNDLMRALLAPALFVPFAAMASGHPDIASDVHYLMHAQQISMALAALSQWNFLTAWELLTGQFACADGSLNTFVFTPAGMAMFLASSSVMLGLATRFLWRLSASALSQIATAGVRPATRRIS